MRRRATALLVLLLPLLACSKATDTPEAWIRALLAQAERAAEGRDVSAVLEHVAQGYRDAEGRDRQAVRGLLVYVFLRNPQIHLLTRVHEIAVDAPDQARVRVFVAMAGHPLGAAAALAELRADLYRFDFALGLEGDDWRVTSADWAPARSDDFL